MKTYSVRIALELDAGPLASLAATTFTDTFGHLYPPEDLQAHLAASYTPQAFRALVEDPAVRLWIAQVGAEWVGFAQAGPCKLPHADARPSHGELMRLYVIPSRKGTGVAQALMDEALAWMKERFDGPVWLGVYCDNLRAQRFYERYGFRKVGEYAYVVGQTRDREFILRRD